MEPNADAAIDGSASGLHRIIGGHKGHPLRIVTDGRPRPVEGKPPRAPRVDPPDANLATLVRFAGGLRGGSDNRQTEESGEHDRECEHPRHHITAKSGGFVTTNDELVLLWRGRGHELFEESFAKDGWTRVSMAEMRSIVVSAFVRGAEFERVRTRSAGTPEAEDS